MSAAGWVGALRKSSRATYNNRQIIGREPNWAKIDKVSAISEDAGPILEKPTLHPQRLRKR